MIGLLAGLGFFLMYLPLGLLVLSSIHAHGEWSTAWYGKALHDETILHALGLTLQVGLAATVIATILGTMAALALARTKLPLQKVFEGAIDLPLVMPEIVMALSLLVWFVLLKISLGRISIILAHATFCLSYVTLTVRARLEDFDASLEEAAQDLGASPLRVFWKVTFPLIWPGILSAALMAFTLSFDDFLITFFTAGAGSDTLPLKIYAMVKFGVNPEINAVSTMMLGATLVGVLGFLRPFRRV